MISGTVLPMQHSRTLKILCQLPKSTPVSLMMKKEVKSEELEPCHTSRPVQHTVNLTIHNLIQLQRKDNVIPMDGTWTESHYGWGRPRLLFPYQYIQNTTRKNSQHLYSEAQTRWIWLQRKMCGQKWAEKMNKNHKLPLNLWPCKGLPNPFKGKYNEKLMF